MQCRWINKTKQVYGVAMATKNTKLPQNEQTSDRQPAIKLFYALSGFEFSDCNVTFFITLHAKFSLVK